MQLTATERSSFGRVMKTSLGKCKINWPTAAGILDLGRLTRRSGKGSSNTDSTRRVLSLKDSITKNYISQCKVCYFVLYGILVSLTFIFDLREDLSLNTWSLSFSLFYKYTTTSAKHNK